MVDNVTGFEAQSKVKFFVKKSLNKDNQEPEKREVF